MHIQHEIRSHPENEPARIVPFKPRYRGRTYPWHWHESLELVYNVDADLTYHVGDLTYRIPEDGLLLVNAYAPHRLDAVTHGYDTLCILDRAFLTRWTGGQYYDQYLFDPLIGQPMDANTRRIREILLALTTLAAAKTPLNRLKAMSLSTELLAILCEHYTVPAAHALDHDNGTALAQYIKSHIREPLTLAAVAQHFNYSYSYLSRYCHQVVGVSFTQYVATLRVDLAMLELMDHRYSIEDVALHAGFANTRAYLRAFQRQYHLAPAEFRREHLAHPEQAVQTYLL
ncbi:helix-turn-helix transcriptional regulator [Lacticaseibacillus parakribbianus]|uniref:helix-turn-helix transcriptional regulator n=1 Tax=Lacticaseibacillus parakribbianus TaxID=2970927 RepID=UPI0021CB8870|nr:AraC family transcriptional regulator [Lacticaseibacillus parakribbianus]